MESSGERSLLEVSGQGIRSTNPARGFAVYWLSGCLVGLAMTNALLTRLRPATGHYVISATIFVIVCTQAYLLALEWRDFRKFKQEIERQRVDLLRFTKEELTRLFPDNPVYVARIMLHLQEGIFKP
jgi:hypothetical protein